MPHAFSIKPFLVSCGVEGLDGVGANLLSVEMARGHGELGVRRLCVSSAGGKHGLRIALCSARPSSRSPTLLPAETARPSSCPLNSPWVDLQSLPLMPSTRIFPVLLNMSLSRSFNAPAGNFFLLLHSILSLYHCPATTHHRLPPASPPDWLTPWSSSQAGGDFWAAGNEGSPGSEE